MKPTPVGRPGEIFGWAPDPQWGVLDWRILLICLGAGCFLKGLVSLWHHEFQAALGLLSLVAAVLIVLRNAPLFILGIVMFIAVNAGITAVVDHRYDSLAMAVVSYLLADLMVRLELKKRRCF